MKPMINIRQTATFALFTVVLGCASLVSLANGHERKGDRMAASAAEVKYVSGKEGEALFNVTYSNTAGSRFSLIVLDAEGNQLFQNVYTDKKFDKTFKIAEPESYGRLIFVIRNFSDNSVQRFEVNSSSRMVEDIDVKEVQ